MRREDLDAFVRAIEDHLGPLRGGDRALSPRDFALARDWHAAGVPLALVLQALDGAQAEGATPTLAYCRRRVEARAERGLAGPDPGSSAVEPPGEDVTRVLDAFLEAVARLTPATAARFEAPCRHARDLRDLLAVAPRPNWSWVRDKLQEIDVQVAAAVLLALPAEELAAYEQESARSATRQRVSAAAMAAARREHAARRGRERLGLPRLGLP